MSAPQAGQAGGWSSESQRSEPEPPCGSAGSAPAAARPAPASETPLLVGSSDPGQGRSWETKRTSCVFREGGGEEVRRCSGREEVRAGAAVALRGGGRAGGGAARGLPRAIVPAAGGAGGRRGARDAARDRPRGRRSRRAARRARGRQRLKSAREVRFAGPHGSALRAYLALQFTLGCRVRDRGVKTPLAAAHSKCVAGASRAPRASLVALQRTVERFPKAPEREDGSAPTCGSRNFRPGSAVLP